MRPEYNQSSTKILRSGDISIASFLSEKDFNLDQKTVSSFGEEWQKFHHFNAEELNTAGNEYFDLVTDTILNQQSLVLDLGCGSGRWSYFIAGKAGWIESVDPSDAVLTAAQLLKTINHARVTQASVDNIPFPDDTFDLLICLGVLHHIPNTQQALNNAIQKVKPGGHALLYFYYDLENRGAIYKGLFKCVDVLRRIISSFPKVAKQIACDIIAVFVYMPLILLSRLLKFISPNGEVHKHIPLSYYTNKSFQIIRNDALDRFGTPLEKRYSKEQITEMCREAGLDHILFSPAQPYWHLIARKRPL